MGAQDERGDHVTEPDGVRPSTTYPVAGKLNTPAPPPSSPV
jgi:hypothetical protein